MENRGFGKGGFFFVERGLSLLFVSLYDRICQQEQRGRCRQKRGDHDQSIHMIRDNWTFYCDRPKADGGSSYMALSYIHLLLLPNLLPIVLSGYLSIRHILPFR